MPPKQLYGITGQSVCYPGRPQKREDAATARVAVTKAVEAQGRQVFPNQYSNFTFTTPDATRGTVWILRVGEPSYGVAHFQREASGNWAVGCPATGSLQVVEFTADAKMAQQWNLSGNCPPGYVPPSPPPASTTAAP